MQQNFELKIDAEELSVMKLPSFPAQCTTSQPNALVKASLSFSNKKDLL
jgi:hypothetical protein